MTAIVSSIDMLDHVHVNEKWYYMQSDGIYYLLALGEEPPFKTMCYKSYIQKVMF